MSILQNNILGYISRIAKIIGIDKAIFFTTSARIIQGIGGIVSVIFIARYLNGIEQGFYFTFSSILAIQIFFELGLNGIITQYVAHEVSHLDLNEDKYEGNQKYLSRLASLLHFCIRWYRLLAILLFVILNLVGYVFFNHFYDADEKVNWILPWVILSFGTTLYFLISPFVAFIEGLGKVKEVSKIRLIQQIFSMFTLWSGLFFGLKLYVGGISTLVGLTVLFFFIIRKFRPLLKNIYIVKVVEKVSYKSEIFPYQWKIALSWVSGYFIFQLFNPILFATEGAIVAGQMGMTLAVLNAILGLSQSWITTKIPTFSGYIAQKKYLLLDKLFNKTLIQSSIINLLGLFGFIIALFIIRYYNISIGEKSFSDRFLNFLPLIFMMIPIFVNHIVYSLAIYLRCHKQEPMLIQSITIGILCALSTILFGRYYGVIGITSGYMTLTILSFIWTTNIFKTKKNEWHK